MPKTQSIVLAYRGIAQKLGRFREAGLVVALLTLIVVVGAMHPLFLSSDNLFQVLQSVSILSIVVVGQTVVVLTRNVDLSVGSIVGLTAFAAGMELKSHPQIPAVLVLAMGAGIGVALGMVNGGLVALGKVPAIVATLGTRSVFRATIFILAGGAEITASDLPNSYIAISNWLILFAVAVAAVFAVGLRSSRTGREVYAVGSNPDAARLAGLNADRLIFGAFLTSGLLSGLGGALWTARFAAVNANSAGGLELQVVAAVVVGGVNIFGGSGTVVGAVLGIILLGLIENALTVLHINPFWLQAIYGAAILAAVSLDASLMRRLKQLRSNRGTA